MTPHLSDEQLNEILDGRLNAPHLDSCNDCQTRLADLRALFVALESLPEKNSPRNLTASILARLPQTKTSRAWNWVLTLQAASALSIFIWFANLFQIPTEFTAYQLPTFESLLAQLATSISNLQFSLPSLPAIPSNLQLSTFNLSLLLASAAALWIVGNNFLLRTPTQKQRR